LSLARHTFYNFAGQALPLLVSLLVIPVYLQLIGEVRFGILALIWLLVGYTAVLDFGVGQAVTRELAKGLQHAQATAASLLRTALLIALALGAAGALLLWSLGHWYASKRSSIDPDLLGELLLALPIAGSIVPLVAAAGVLNGALQARRRFAELNLVGVATQVLVLLAPLVVAARVGTGLPGLVAAVAVARLVMFAVLLWRCSAELRGAGEPGRQDGLLRRLIGFGGWTTVSAVIAPLLLALDRLLIGSQLGAPAVSHYTIPFQLAERTTAPATAFGQALFPRLAAAHDENERRGMALRSLGLVALATAPVAAIGPFLIGPFLEWWLSAEFAQRSAQVARVLWLAFWLSSLATVPYILLLASGRPDRVAWVHLLQLPPYVALLLAGLTVAGLEGAAWAFALRVSADLVLLLLLCPGLAQAAARMLAVPVLAVFALGAVAMLDDAATGPRWLIGLAALGALGAWSVSRLRQDMPFSGRIRL
jgi:O-antigen/teichoic acid export membrane protein